jgi:DNA repair protein SbcD/Mre11
MNFIHLADMHLGYRQYDLEQRFIDFGHTFKIIIDHAIANKVDFVLISGDLFDKRSINAPTYVQANQVLSLLKDAGIPCIAIEGNHDRRFVKDGMSWLESLEWEGLLKVIKNDGGSLMSGHADVGGTRIFGLGFSGSMTSAAIPQIAQDIREINAEKPPEYTILMMHAGVQGKMKYDIPGEVTYEDLCQLKDTVNYLALGHYHIAYRIDDWAYNPGCPDTCSITEVDESKGFYHVTDTGAELIEAKIRKFIRLPVNADRHNDPESLISEIMDQLSRHQKSEKPIIHVIIKGTLNFDRSHLNLDTIMGLVKEKSDALYVDVRLDLMNDEFSIAQLESDSFDRSAIEREVFRKLARSDSMLAGNSDLFAASLSYVKDLAVKGADGPTLDGVLRKLYSEVRNGASSPAERAILEAEIAVKPIKKARKKPQKPGQLALDWGDGQ